MPNHLTRNRLVAVAALLIALSSVEVRALPAEPQALDAWLLHSEQAHIELTAGAEKTIDWFATPGQKTPLSLIYLHGFSATRQETAPLALSLGQQLGANVFHTRLTGHGLPGDALAATSMQDWLDDVEQAYRIGRMIGDRVIVVSVSTGSTLSTWLAAQPFADRIAAMVMLSPNFDLPDQGVYRIDWPLGIGVKLAEWTVGEHYSWEPSNEGHQRYWTYHYPIRALRPMVQLLKQVRKIDKGAIEVPTLMVYSPNDQVVSVPAIVDTFAQFGSEHKRLISFEAAEDPSQHVIAGDILSPGATTPIRKLVLEFLNRLQLNRR